jgi:hypothetical protein
LYYGDKIGLAPKLGTIYKERTNIGDARNMGIEIFAEIDFLKIRDEKAKNGLSWTKYSIGRADVPSRSGSKPARNPVGRLWPC